MSLDEAVRAESSETACQSDESERLLAQAILMSANADEELDQARTARTEAEQVHDEAESIAFNAIERLLADLRAQAQGLTAEAAQANKDAEADRLRAAEELKRAETTISETERLCGKMVEEARRRAGEFEAKARRRADAQAHQAVSQAVSQAEASIAEMKRRAAEEVREIVQEITTIRDAARQEMETQSILAGAARLVTHASTIWPAGPGRSVDPAPPVSDGKPKATNRGGAVRRRGRPN